MRGITIASDIPQGKGESGEVTPDSFFSPYSPKCLEKLSEKVSERSAT